MTVYQLQVHQKRWISLNDTAGAQTEKYIYSHIAGALTFIPYGILVDHFQHEVYEHPEMTKKERKATFRRLEKMYIPERNYEGFDILEFAVYRGKTNVGYLVKGAKLLHYHFSYIL